MLVSTINTRYCFNCKKEYPLTSEYFYKSNKYYFQTECISCNKIRRSLWWKSDKGKLSSANTKLKSRFNLTLEQYNKLSHSQNNTCLICKINRSKHRLAVDHDHKTGKIRGLLCKPCNIALGNFADNITYLEEAIKYLRGELQ